jgi:hypothetical protein
VEHLALLFFQCTLSTKCDLTRVALGIKPPSQTPFIPHKYRNMIFRTWLAITAIALAKSVQAGITPVNIGILLRQGEFVEYVGTTPISTHNLARDVLSASVDYFNAQGSRLRRVALAPSD